MTNYIYNDELCKKCNQLKMWCKCSDKRKEIIDATTNHKTPIQRQIVTTGTELDRLRWMLDDEKMKKVVQAMRSVLTKWEVE